MAIYRLRTVYKVFLGLCLVLLTVLLSTEIFFSFPEGDASHDDLSANPKGFIQWSENSEGFQEGEGKKFDFLEVDENWIDRYSEGGLTMALSAVGSGSRCKLTEVRVCV